jgi:hypothetical protein
MKTIESQNQLFIYRVIRGICDNASILFAMTRHRPTVVAAIATLHLYVFVYRFKAGYLDYFHLPTSFVVISLTTVIDCLMNSWLYLTSSIGLVITAVGFTQIRNELPCRLRPMADIIAVLLLVAMSSITGSYFFLWLQVVYFGIVWYPWKKEKAIRALFFNSFFVLIVQYQLAYHFGLNHAEKQSTYLTHEERGQSWVLIDSSENRYVSAKFLPVAKTVLAEFLVLDNSVKPNFVLKKTGKLSVRSL